MKKHNKNLIAFNDHFIQQYGKPGTSSRDQFKRDFEAFRLEVMLCELKHENTSKTITKPIDHG